MSDKKNETHKTERVQTVTRNNLGDLAQQAIKIKHNKLKAYLKKLLADAQGIYDENKNLLSDNNIEETKKKLQLLKKALIMVSDRSIKTLNEIKNLGKTVEQESLNRINQLHNQIKGIINTAETKINRINSLKINPQNLKNNTLVIHPQILALLNKFTQFSPPTNTKTTKNNSAINNNLTPNDIFNSISTTLENNRNNKNIYNYLKNFLNELNQIKIKNKNKNNNIDHDIDKWMQLIFQLAQRYFTERLKEDNAKTALELMIPVNGSQNTAGTTKSSHGGLPGMIEVGTEAGAEPGIDPASNFAQAIEKFNAATKLLEQLTMQPFTNLPSAQNIIDNAKNNIHEGEQLLDALKDNENPSENTKANSAKNEAQEALEQAESYLKNREVQISAHKSIYENQKQTIINHLNAIRDTIIPRSLKDTIKEINNNNEKLENCENMLGNAEQLVNEFDTFYDNNESSSDFAAFMEKEYKPASTAAKEKMNDLYLYAKLLEKADGMLNNVPIEQELGNKNETESYVNSLEQKIKKEQKNYNDFLKGMELLSPYKDNYNALKSKSNEINKKIIQKLQDMKKLAEEHLNKLKKLETSCGELIDEFVKLQKSINLVLNGKNANPKEKKESLDKLLTEAKNLNEKLKETNTEYRKLTREDLPQFNANEKKNNSFIKKIEEQINKGTSTNPLKPAATINVTGADAINSVINFIATKVRDTAAGSDDRKAFLPNTLQGDKGKVDDLHSRRVETDVSATETNLKNALFNTPANPTSLTLTFKSQGLSNNAAKRKKDFMEAYAKKSENEDKITFFKDTDGHRKLTPGVNEEINLFHCAVKGKLLTFTNLNLEKAELTVTDFQSYFQRAIKSDITAKMNGQDPTPEQMKSNIMKTIKEELDKSLLDDKKYQI